jgi:anti-anti-sigma factor
MAVSLSVPRAQSGAPRVELAAGQAPGEVVVRVWGEARFEHAGELAASLVGLNALRPPRVTLDLGGLSFISSLALGVLTSFRRGIVRAGGTVWLAADLQEPVRQALERTDLLALFTPPAETEVATRICEVLR